MDLQNIIEQYTHNPSHTRIMPVSLHKLCKKYSILILQIILTLFLYCIFFPISYAVVSSDDLENYVIEITYLNKESIEYAKGSEKLNLEEESVKKTELKDIKNNKIAYLDQESLQYEDTPKEETEQETKKQTKNKQEQIEEEGSEATSKTVDSTEIDEDEDEDDPEKYTRLDPLIDYNRDMYYVNKNIDKYLIKPPAKVYSYIVPSPVKHMVTNFFSNIQDVNVLINDFLQLEVENSVATIYRIFLNSTFGVFGLLDVAGDSGYPKRANDFGVTFGKWFEPESVYFVIPILGPSTIRDTVGTAIGGAISFGYYLPNDYVLPLTGLYVLDKRSNLLTTEKIIDTIADEEYIFVRNAYLDYRARLISGESLSKKDEEKEQKMLDEIISPDVAPSDKKLEDLDELEDLE